MDRMATDLSEVERHHFADAIAELLRVEAEIRLKPSEVDRIIASWRATSAHGRTP